VFAGAMGGELLRVLEARGMSIAHDESS
jgi:hypothetical protein